MMGHPKLLWATCVSFNLLSGGFSGQHWKQSPKQSPHKQERKDTSLDWVRDPNPRPQAKCLVTEPPSVLGQAAWLGLSVRLCLCFLQLCFSMNIFQGLCFCSTPKQLRSHGIPERTQLPFAGWPNLSWKLLVSSSAYCTHPEIQACPVSIRNTVHRKEKIPRSTTSIMLARRWYVN